MVRSAFSSCIAIAKNRIHKKRWPKVKFVPSPGSQLYDIIRPIHAQPPIQPNLPTTKDFGRRFPGVTVDEITKEEMTPKLLDINSFLLCKFRSQQIETNFPKIDQEAPGQNLPEPPEQKLLASNTTSSRGILPIISTMILRMKFVKQPDTNRMKHP
jgi:hypothetical protein